MGINPLDSEIAESSNGEESSDDTPKLPPSKARINRDRKVLASHPKNGSGDGESDDRDCFQPFDSEDFRLPDNLDNESLAGKNSGGATSFEWSDELVPYNCPSEDCHDNVPANLPPALYDLFRQRAKLIHQEGRDASTLPFLTGKLCLELKVFRAAEHAKRRAEKNGYGDIHFQSLADRIRTMRPIIDPFMDNADGRLKTFVWENLISDMQAYNLTMAKLNKGKNIPLEMENMARPG